jgi:hypothetical protein
MIVENMIKEALLKYTNNHYLLLESRLSYLMNIMTHITPSRHSNPENPIAIPCRTTSKLRL